MKKPTLYHESKLKELDETMSSKLIELSRKYPVVCYEYLDGIDKISIWASNQLRKINEE